jgi:Na+/H+ antiporter NhaA
MDQVKIGVLTGSLVAGLSGFLILRFLGSSRASGAEGSG